MTSLPQPPAYRDPRHGSGTDRPWLAAFLLGAANCLALGDRALIAFLAPALKASLGLSDAMLGLLIGTAFALPYVLGLALFASFGAAIGRLLSVRLSLVAWTAATIACGLAPSVGALLAARIALGLSQAPLTPAAATHLTGLFPAGTVGRGTSVFTAGATLGRSIAFLGGGAALAWIGLPLLGANEGWRAVFVVSVVPSAVLLVALSRLNERSTVPAPRTPEPGLWTWLSGNWRGFATHTVAAAMIVAVIQTLTAWTTTVLVSGHGLTLASAGSLFGTIVLAGAPLGHLGGGVLLDSLRRYIGARSPGLLIAGSLAVSLPAVTLFGLASRLDLALVGLTAATFLLGLGVPACLAGIQALAPHALRTRVTALHMACITTAGFGLGPPLVGALSDWLGGSAWMGESITVVAASATLIGMAAVVAQFSLRIARRERSYS